LRQLRLTGLRFRACQGTDDLDFTVPYIDENQIVIDTDYGHSKNTIEIEVIRKLRHEDKLSSKVVDRIFSIIARRFYGL